MSVRRSCRVFSESLRFSFLFVVLSLVMLFLTGCDLLVSDNPACQYDCAVNSTRSVGGP